MSFPMLVIVAVALILVAYLLGSIPFAVVISRVMGLNDPRHYGSKNPGATNVLRSGNKAAAALTLLGDAAKGWLAVCLVAYIVREWGLPGYTIGLAGVAAFLGHLFPVFLKFKGGKGVATALGVLLAFEPWLAVATVATWLIVAYASRYSSLAAIVSAIFVPLYYIFGGGVAWYFQSSICTAIVVISALLCYRHKENIARLIAGKETRIGQKSPAAQVQPAANKTRRHKR